LLRPHQNSEELAALAIAAGAEVEEEAAAAEVGGGAEDEDVDEEGGNEEEEDDDDVSGDSGDEVATGTGAGSFDDDESVLSDVNIVVYMTRRVLHGVSNLTNVFVIPSVLVGVGHTWSIIL
jgi:hypothetical protein